MTTPDPASTTASISGAPRIDVRDAAPADAAWIAPLFDAYRGFYRKASDLPAAERWLHERLTRGEAHVFIATTPAGHGSDPPLCAPRDGHQPAGFALLYPGFTSVALSTRWTLNDLFVDPAFRRLGIGRLLTLRAMLLTQTSGAAACQLLTEHANTSAQALYAALGWTRDMEYQRWTWKAPA